MAKKKDIHVSRRNRNFKKQIQRERRREELLIIEIIKSIAKEDKWIIDYCNFSTIESIFYYNKDQNYSIHINYFVSAHQLYIDTWHWSHNKTEPFFHRHTPLNYKDMLIAVMERYINKFSLEASDRITQLFVDTRKYYASRINLGHKYNYKIIDLEYK